MVSVSSIDLAELGSLFFIFLIQYNLFNYKKNGYERKTGNISDNE